MGLFRRKRIAVPPGKVEKVLVGWLRLVGTAALLALVPAFMPVAWMDTVHRGLGLGTLPEAPIVGYLARSASVFYAFFGGLMWLTSTRPRRYRRVLLYVGAAAVFLGLFLGWFGNQQGLPLWWNIAEVVVNVTIGAVILGCTLLLGGE